MVSTKKKKREDYELVPLKRFEDLSEKVLEISKNPFLEKSSAKRVESLLEAVNDSIVSLLDVMKVLSEDMAFDEKEKHLIKQELRPVVKSIDEIKEQNETIANAMVNIIDRISDLQKQVSTIEKNITPRFPERRNPTLPPLESGSSFAQKFPSPKSPSSNDSLEVPATTNAASQKEESLPPPPDLPPFK